MASLARWEALPERKRRNPSNTCAPAPTGRDNGGDLARLSRVSPERTAKLPLGILRGPRLSCLVRGQSPPASAFR